MQLNPAEYVIKVFGGVRATARALNKAPSSISKWHSKKQIPTSSIPVILEKSQEMGLDITPQDLVMGRKVEVSEY